MATRRSRDADGGHRYRRVSILVRTERAREYLASFDAAVAKIYRFSLPQILFGALVLYGSRHGLVALQ